MESVRLIGAEQVESASIRMIDAAEDMQRAASAISEALRLHGQLIQELMDELNRLENEGGK